MSAYTCVAFLIIGLHGHCRKLRLCRIVAFHECWKIIDIADMCKEYEILHWTMLLRYNSIVLDQLSLIKGLLHTPIWKLLSSARYFYTRKRESKCNREKDKCLSIWSFEVEEAQATERGRGRWPHESPITEDLSNEKERERGQEVTCAATPHDIFCFVLFIRFHHIKFLWPKIIIPVSIRLFD